MESAVSFAPLRPADFINFAGRGGACFLQGGAGRGGARPAFRGAGRGGPGRGSLFFCGAGRGGAGRPSLVGMTKNESGIASVD